MRVDEADGQGGAEPVHEEGQTQNCFNTKPYSSDQDKNLFVLESTIQAHGIADDTNNKGRNHHTESFKARSVHFGRQTDQAQHCKTESNNVASDHGSSGIAAAAAGEEGLKERRNKGR
jgi:hypothetical protein